MFNDIEKPEFKSKVQAQSQIEKGKMNYSLTEKIRENSSDLGLGLVYLEFGLRLVNSCP